MKMAKSNEGSVKTSAHKGMKIDTPYGKCDSDISGSANQERIGAHAGGKSDLSHSLSGNTAKQRAGK